MSPRMPPKASYHRGAGGDAANQPENAPRLQALILSICIDQHGLQSEPSRPKPSNHMGAGGNATNDPENAPTREAETP